MKISVSFSRAGALFQLAGSASCVLRRFTRQIAAKGKPLALEPRGHQREHDGRRADQRHYAKALAVRFFDQRSAGVGDGGATSLRQQAQRPLCPQRGERVALLADHLDAQLADRHVQRAEERARAFSVFDDEVAEGANHRDRRGGQGLARRAAERRGDAVENQSTGNPARSSIPVSAISGSPIRALGSSVWMRWRSAMPRPSALAAPAQS